MSVFKMKIGEVHSLLRNDYPDIELSKIRYYEEKGLVRPDRSRKGYRLYSERDVECLREAFRLAQQEYVPLRVVRQRLIEQGLLDEDTTSMTTRSAATASVSVVSAPVERASLEETSAPVVELVTSDPVTMTGPASLPLRLSRDELLEQSGLASRQLDEMVHYGFICPRDAVGRTHYDESDLSVAKVVAAMVTRGIDVRHLQVLKRTVDRQIDLLSDITAPARMRGQHEGSSKIEDEVVNVANELQALRSMLLDRAMRAYLGA